MLVGNECMKRNGNLDIFEHMEKHHTSQLEICARLEALADGLPDNVDNQECISLARQIYNVVREAHEFEERKFFPALEAQTQASPDLLKSIERLKFEHWEDESTAEDLSISLRSLIEEPGAENIDKISYMLRGFFEGLRRHIAYESDYLFPILKKA